MREYILSVLAAAVVCCIVMKLVDDKSGIGMLCRMICGVFLTLSVLKPLGQIQIDGLWELSAEISEAGEAATFLGESMAKEARAGIIKQETEAYILDKAGLYDCQPTVEVTVGEGEVPIPESVCIKGNVSPYAKAMLQKLIAEDLGIAKENQQWIG